MKIHEAQALLNPIADADHYWERKQLAKTTNDLTLLTLLTQDNVATVRREVAANKFTTGDLLHILVTRNEPGVNVINAAAAHPNLLPETIDYLIEVLPNDERNSRIYTLIEAQKDNFTSPQLLRLWNKLTPRRRISLLSYKNFPIYEVLDQIDLTDSTVLNYFALNPNLDDKLFGMYLNALPAKAPQKQEVAQYRSGNAYSISQLLINPDLSTERLFALLGYLQFHEPFNIPLMNSLFSHRNFPIEVAYDYLESDERFIWGFAMNPNITPDLFDYILNHPQYPLFTESGFFKQKQYHTDDIRNDAHHWAAHHFINYLVRNPNINEIMTERMALHPSAIEHKDIFLSTWGNPFKDRAIFALFSQNKAIPLEYLDNQYALKRIVRKLAKYHEPEVAEKATRWLEDN